MKTQHLLQLEDASAISQACKIRAAELNVAVSIVVLDGHGHLMLSERLDGAQFQTPDVAKGKALTAVMMRQPSRVIENAALARLTLCSFQDSRLPIQGGLPLFIHKACVGSVGVSGGSPEQDEVIAEAGIEYFMHQIRLP